MRREAFVSYRSEDKEWAERICAALESENLSCWIAPRDIPLGKEWATAIVENLQCCKVFVVVLSSHRQRAMAGRVRRELRFRNGEAGLCHPRRGHQ